MGEIKNESKFWYYMNVNGPEKTGSKNNYISWLKYISKNYNIIDDNITKEKIENIYKTLLSTLTTRDKYNQEKDAINIRSALRKYLSFIQSNYKNDHFTSDLYNILDSEKITDKKSEIEIRIGQGKFRENLIALWGKCAITGFEKKDLLVASHIKPWRNSNNKERIDPYNGLLFTPNIDKLFDRGYISFDDKGMIIFSKLLSDEDIIKLNIKKDLK